MPKRTPNLYIAKLLAATCLFSFLFSVTSTTQRPSLQITSPSDGTLVPPGQNLTVSVSSPNGTSFTYVAIIGENPIGSSDSSTSSLPAQLTVGIPGDIGPGRYSLTAVGRTTAGRSLSSSPITVDVERADMPLSLSAATPSIRFDTISQSVPLIVRATFSNGTILDVRRSSYISFSSSNTAVATVDGRGIVTAVAAGRTSITAWYTLGTDKIQLIIPVTVA